MMAKKKKAQVALEILIIFGVLVIGSLLFAVYYVRGINDKLDSSSNIQGTYSDFEKNIQSQDPITKLFCGDARCVDETCSSCPIDCGNCPQPPPILYLSLNPLEDTPQGAAGHNKFGITANINNYDIGKTITITKINISTRDGEPVNYCYKGTTPILNGELSINAKMIENSGNYSYDFSDFSCTVYDYYKFELTANISGESTTISNPVEKYINRLTASTFLSPDGRTPENISFGLDINVNNYNSDSDINITKIYVKDANSDKFTSSCYYNDDPIPAQGYLLNNIMMTKNGNDYNYSFSNKFKCKSSGEYNIILTLHDNDENTDYDYNAIIQKGISDRCEFVFTSKEINNASDLDCIRYGLSFDYTLQNDIDLNHAKLSAYDWYDSVKGWNPIGTYSSASYGNLNGNGYTIRNMYQNRPDEPVGLFYNLSNAKLENFNLEDINIVGYGGGLVLITENSEIKDINITGIVNISIGGGLVGIMKDSNVTNCSFTGSVIAFASFTGGLIGDIRYVSNSSYISDSFFSGTYFSDASYSGGLIGISADSIINNCYTTGTVQGAGGCTGGLIGGGGRINNSYSDADVTGTSITGGLCGCFGDITDSYFTGNVIMQPLSPIQDAYYVGGLAGSGESIKKSYSIGNIIINNSAHTVGGLVGTGVEIENSYSTGDITISGTASKIGGLVGETGGSLSGTGIINSYSTGHINKTGYRIGGLVGYNAPNQYLSGLKADINNSYWDINTSSQATSDGGEGRSTIEMKQQATFLDWNFVNYWEIDEGISYPYFQVVESPSEPKILDGGDRRVLDSGKDFSNPLINNPPIKIDK